MPTGAGSATAATSPCPSLDNLASFARTHLFLSVCLANLETTELREEQAACLKSYQTWLPSRYHRHIKMSPALESTDAKNKLEDLSGVKIKPGENPYKALIEACHDDTVRAGLD